MPAINKPDYIVIHTAAHGDESHNYDTTAAQIDEWHKERGWRGIGYHYVIRLNGTIEKGRDEKDTGAHTRGLNQRSIGICLSGNADFHNWTDAQTKACDELVKSLMTRYNIPVSHVIGHREAGINGNPGYVVHKTCPGLKIDMVAYRASLKVQRPTLVADVTWGKELYEAMKTLYNFAAANNLTQAALKELHDVRYSEPFNTLINKYKETL